MKEIGSHFHLKESAIQRIQDKLKGNRSVQPDGRIDAVNPQNFGNSRIYFSSGRSAIRFCLKEVAETATRARSVLRKSALVPEYTCASVLEPFLREGWQLNFYPLEPDLTVRVSVWNRLIEQYQPDAMLFHPFFGFDTIIADEPLVKQDTKIIYDMTQSWASGLSYPYADFVVASLRKWGPLPDGAFAEKCSGLFWQDPPQREDGILLELTLDAYRGKDRFLSRLEGNKADFLSQFANAGNRIAAMDESYQMSAFSQAVWDEMTAAPAKDSWMESRRQNFSRLAAYSGWSDLGRPYFGLTGGSVPLYFPIELKNGIRKRLQSFLAQKGIYCPVIWPVPEQVNIPASDDLRRIQENCLCIPIDQRYGMDDMNRIMESLNEFGTDRNSG